MIRLAVENKIATSSQRRREETKLLVMDERSNKIEHSSFGSLETFLEPSDWLIVNSAATVPASFKGVHQTSGASVEIRLAGRLESENRWLAIVLGRGDWRMRTEDRGAVPLIATGDVISLSNTFSVTVTRVRTAVSSRLLEVEFSDCGAEFWKNLFELGKPIQYSYLEKPLDVWDQQTIFSSYPVAVEPPSASFAFTWELVWKLKKRGIRIRSVLHATGLSDTGDARLNEYLPFPEISSVDRKLGQELVAAKENGNRIIAVGTGVVRALETWARSLDSDGEVSTELKLGGGNKPILVDGLITGLHEEGASHLHLLRSFLIDPKFLDSGYAQAVNRGYLWHEFGDLNLLIGKGD